MNYSRYKIHLRLLEFWRRIRNFHIFDLSDILYLSGFVIISFFLMFSLTSNFANIVPLILIIGYFWVKSENILSSKLKLPSEILLALLLILYLIERAWFFLLVNAGVHPLTGDIFPGLFPTLIQVFWLSIIIFFFCYLLVTDSKTKWFNPLLYLGLGFVGLNLIRHADPNYWLIFQFILLLMLYRHTAWVEVLTKRESWIAFLVILVIFLIYDTLPLLHPPIFNTASLIWYYIPKLLSHYLLLYLLAILLKIPFVLVYHHASLRRKFQIAGWLQSSIPQFIQLTLLLLVFYFFISGWQAQNLKNAILKLTEQAQTGKQLNQLTIFRFQAADSDQQVKIPGYQAFNPNSLRIMQGVISLPSIPGESTDSQNDYFLFSRSGKKESSRLVFIKIDTLLLKKFEDDLSFIVASGIITYPFQANGWDSVLYKMRWRSGDDTTDIHLFPFGITPNETSDIFLHKFAASSTDPEPNSSRILIMRRDMYTAGRVYLSLLDQNLEQVGLWAFDITILTTISFFTSTLMKQLLFWIIIYFLINLLIIRRVIKFGNQINQKIVEKFNQLTQGIRQLGGGNLNYRIEMEGEDEFLELADHFNRMGNELQKKIAEVREKDRLEHELKIAREVQVSLLPSTLPEIRGYRIQANIKTATEVGGDFYDVLPLDAEKFLFVIGDVSGKGTSAAFYMAQCISLIRFSTQFTKDPRELLLRLNRYFSEPLVDRQIFVTAVVGVLDIKRHSISFYRAGHNQPIYIPVKSQLKVEELKSPGMGIGLERQGDLFRKTLKVKTTRIEKGDTLFMYTDGLVEASSYEFPQRSNSENAEFFGEERLLNTLNTMRGADPAAMVQEINREISQFYGDTPLIDDLTMLIIQRQIDKMD